MSYWNGQRDYYGEISIKVDIEYAMDIKAELMKDDRLDIQQDRQTKSATLTTNHPRYESEYIKIEPADGSRYTGGCQGGAIQGHLLNQIKKATRIQVYEPQYNLTFNLAAFDTILGALQLHPNPGIESEIMDALLPCAKAAPYMFFDKLIHKLPEDVQIDYLFRMHEFMPDKDKDQDLLR